MFLDSLQLVQLSKNSLEFGNDTVITSNTLNNRNNINKIFLFTIFDL
jgi:hypothetical protein